ncbi:phenylacetic acid degradation protein [Marinospirillum celere]|uniref:Phenylacetic acid degradation protein n=1 Tax=Marinospirillum celere TaxID=1122252 RepID=A0A1I1I865_9GAMM|nr:phenylacetic acid degradation protein PaaY [Marinospirillum celere]SFC29410.1 phenylacetic acid degradation protein [Marinospirillum celere]
MPCYKIEGVVPVIHPTAYVHPTAVLIGDVEVGPNCYVGPHACLRGDFGRIVLKEGSNVQDTCVMHAFPGMDAIIEKDGHIGHGAVLHGCVIEEDALVGMNAVIMDGARIAPRSIVAATAFVKAGFTCEPESLIIGSPAKVHRQLSADEIKWKQEGTEEYQRLTERCHASLEECEPLTEIEPNRPQLDAGNSQPLHAPKK